MISESPYTRIARQTTVPLHYLFPSGSQHKGAACCRVVSLAIADAIVYHAQLRLLREAIDKEITDDPEAVRT